MANPSSILPALRILSGTFIWALHFAISYGFTAFACARGLASIQWLGIGVVAWVVGGATVLALLGASWVGLGALRMRGFARQMTGGVAALASLAVVWEALPALMVPACA